MPIDHFRYIKIQLGSEALRTQTKETELTCLFICLCPLSLTIKLNFNISKVIYWFMVSVRLLSYGHTWEVAMHKRSARVARGYSRVQL